MKQPNILGVLDNILLDKGIPRSIKVTVEKSLGSLRANCSVEEKISNIISVLDDVSNDPNVSAYARTQIWSALTVLEGYNR